MSGHPAPVDPLGASTRAALVAAHPGVVVDEPARAVCGWFARVHLPNGRRVSVALDDDGTLEVMGDGGDVVRPVSPERVLVLVARAARKPPRR